MKHLSVAIITKNEAHNIAECIRSVAFADEVVVVDSGSTDGTVAIAQAEGARVVVMDWAGDGPQKNRAIDLASGEWFLSLDADERIPPALATEIREAIHSDRADGYRIPRLSMYAGKFIRHGGWRPDYTWRLARRGHARYTPDRMHAYLQVQGRRGTLANSIIHYSYLDLDSVIEKVNRYSSGRAQDMAAMGRRGSFGRAIFHGLWAFFRTYVLRLGFLDGRWGFMLAFSNAEYTYYRYLKLWLMQDAHVERTPRA